MDRKLAATLARYSELAYEPPQTVRAALPDANVIALDRDDTQAYVIETVSHVAVAFRGTQVLSGFSPADVLSNLWFRRKPWRVGKVHRGYREAVLDIVDDLKGLPYDDTRPLYFAGHSMGGCLATLASTVPPGPTATYTFGAPRVGDRTFAAALSNVTRIVNGIDFAPHYPLPFGYRHGGAAWRLGADGALTRISSPWAALRLPVTLAGLTKAVLDHRVGEYVRKLTRIARQSS